MPKSANIRLRIRHRRNAALLASFALLLAVPLGLAACVPPNASTPTATGSSQTANSTAPITVQKLSPPVALAPALTAQPKPQPTSFAAATAETAPPTHPAAATAHTAPPTHLAATTAETAPPTHSVAAAATAKAAASAPPSHQAAPAPTLVASLRPTPMAAASASAPRPAAPSPLSAGEHQAQTEALLATLAPPDPAKLQTMPNHQVAVVAPPERPAAAPATPAPAPAAVIAPPQPPAAAPTPPAAASAAASGAPLTQHPVAVPPAPAPAQVASAEPPPPGVTCPYGSIGMWSRDVIQEPVYVCRPAQP
jgi:hypothetical protein